MGYCTSSAYASYSRGALNSNFASVMEQSGLWAGDGGFQIDVEKATKLVGSVIASSDLAVAEGKNRLHTGTLETEDIENRAEYFGYQMGVSASVGSNSGGKQAGGGTIQSNSRGGANAPTLAAAYDRERSTTYSAISGGDIVIRDATGQKALTGKASEQMLAALNHDTDDAANSLSPIFDKEKIEANFAIMQEVQGQASTFIARRASEADAVKKELNAEEAKGSAKDPAVIKALTAKYDRLKPWLPGGDYRLIATSLIAGVSGNVAAPAANMVVAASVKALQGLGARQIKDLAPHLGGEGSPAHIALHAVLACAGGAAQGTSCTPGAAGASASVVFNHLVSRLNGTNIEELSPSERENRLNMLGSLLAGVSSALEPAAAAQLTSAAKIEAESNALVFELLLPPPVLGQTIGTKASRQTEAMRLLDRAQGRVDEPNLVEWTQTVERGDSFFLADEQGNPQERSGALPPLIPIVPLVDTLIQWAAPEIDITIPGKTSEIAVPLTPPGVLIDVNAQSGSVHTTPLGETRGPILLYQQGKESESQSTGMLGENGPRFASKTIWKGRGKERIDVENPNPGQRPGQIHYQDNFGRKYLFDSKTNSFRDAPRSVNNLLDDPGFKAAIKKGLDRYLGGK